jgi:hypothetical protein
MYDGGYSFQEPLGFSLEISGPQVGFVNEEGDILMVFFGSPINPDKLNSEEILTEFMDSFFHDRNDDYKKGKSYSITIDGIEGVLVDLAGTMMDMPFTGQAVVVQPTVDQFLFGIAFANTGDSENLWAFKAAKLFKEIINSIEFLGMEDIVNTSACIIATDITYGYSEENPIRVGGDAFGGPSRERAYLDNLLGPNGEQLTYERSGSIETDDTILDEFIIKGAGKTIILYIDEYSYSVPMAPVGFTCYKDFPFSKPQS